MSIRVQSPKREISPTEQMLERLKALGVTPYRSANKIKVYAWALGFLAGYDGAARNSPYAFYVQNGYIHKLWLDAYDKGVSFKESKNDTQT